MAQRTPFHADTPLQALLPERALLLAQQLEQTADALGISTSTVRKATDKAEMWEVLQRDYESVTTEKGDKITLMHLQLNDVIAHPDRIVMEKRHGGARVRKCPKCGTEDVDRYTVQYCRCCRSSCPPNYRSLASADPG